MKTISKFQEEGKKTTKKGHKRQYSERFHFEDLSTQIKVTTYAVRGPLVTKAQNYAIDLKNGKKLPFEKIYFLNIGNPQSLGQPPLQFNREVMSCLMNKELIDKNIYHKDVCDRAKFYFSQFKSIGQYSESQGFRFIRQNIANFIEKRDGFPSNLNTIFLTSGAGDGVKLAMQCLINGPKDGIMIPVPRYPLYSAEVTLMNGAIIPYYLKESTGWSLPVEELLKEYNYFLNKGISIKLLCVINPGNPTGQVLPHDNIAEIIKFCYDHDIAILADEVYQINIYHEQKQFHSFKKVLMEMGEPYSCCNELISLHSISKGITGECGLRGGYMELVNINQKVEEEMLKLQSIMLCSSTTGQLAMDLMVNPPTETNASKETAIAHKKQEDELLASLKERAGIVTKYLRKMTNVSTSEIEGAMYAFPSVKFSKNAQAAAFEKNKIVDELYCEELLEKTGIVLVPGTGFGQEMHTYHFRITILVRPAEELEKCMQFLLNFNEEFHKKYE